LSNPDSHAKDSIEGPQPASSRNELERPVNEVQRDQVPLGGGHSINTESNTLPNPDKHESSKNRHPVNTEIVVGGAKVK